MAATSSSQPESDSLQGSALPRTKALVLLVFVPFFIQSVVYLKLLWQYVFVRNDTEYPEGACVYAFLKAWRTGALYTDPLQLPLNVQLYGPAFYIIGAVLAKLAHGDQFLTAEFVRILSLLSFFGSIAIAGYLSWKLERSKPWTAASVIIGIACSWAIPNVASARPDSLSFLFIFGSIAIYQAAQGRSRFLFSAGLAASISFLTKQSTIPVLIALLVDCLIARRFRNAATLVAGSLPVPALLFLLLWLRHEPFLSNFVAIGHGVMDPHSVVPTIINYFRTNQVAIIPVLVACLGATVSWRKTQYRTLLLAAAFGTTASLLALANVGGAANYLVLPWLLMLPLIPAGLTRLEQWTQRSFLVSFVPSVIGVILLLHQRDLLTRHPPGDLDLRALRKYKILSNSPYIEIGSREPQLMDPYFYHDLAVQNLWSFAPIARQIDNQEYDFVLIRGSDGRTSSVFWISGFRGISFWGSEDLFELEKHYRVLCEIREDPDGYLALVPKDRISLIQKADIGNIFRQSCSPTSRRPQVAPGLR